MLYRQKKDFHERLSELLMTPHQIVIKSLENRPFLAHSRPLHHYALPSAFIRSYLAFKSSAGVGPFEATGAANARRTGGIGFPASTRFSHISRISLASRSNRAKTGHRARFCLEPEKPLRTQSAVIQHRLNLRIVPAPVPVKFS